MSTRNIFRAAARLLQVFAFMAIVAFFVCGQHALAQNPHHLQIRVMPGVQADKVNPPKGPTERKVLEQLASGFGVLPPLDTNGLDEWPCFPGSSNPNAADCSSIAPGGAVIGQVSYTQSLADCDASAAGAANCGQIFWFYEDDTGDNTDDLVFSIVVKQGKNYILDSGPIDVGLNPFAAGTNIVVSDDTAFGTQGQTGPGNGFCAGSTETCVNPVKGVATVTVTTTVGISTITSKFNMFLE
jgi:hypothetical protein